MATKKCPNCGKELTDIAVMCHGCGYQYQQIPTKKCKHCQSDISKKAKVCPVCKKKQGGIIKWIVIVIVVLIFIGSLGNSDSNNDSSNSSQQTNISSTQENENTAVPVVEEPKEEPKNETKDKYYVGDVFENKYIKITYTSSYEFTEYNQYNAPQDGYKIICAEFEVENIGNSDQTVMYTDFDGYADGYEVSQSYAPEGTGLDFSLSLSAGRKGNGIVAFEVPEDATEIEIEFSPSFWSSEKVIFVY